MTTRRLGAGFNDSQKYQPFVLAYLSVWPMEERPHARPDGAIDNVNVARCRRLLCCLEDRIGAGLNKLQDLAISVPARQYRPLDAVMLPEQRG